MDPISTLTSFLGLLCAAVLLLACGASSPPLDVGSGGHVNTGGAAGGDAGAGGDGGGVGGSGGGAAGTLTGPSKLSETGLYSDISNRTLAPGVIQFSVRFEAWSDGAEKERWLLLPEGAEIDTSDMDNWKFPVGTKAWKQFKRDGVLVETRLLWKQIEGKEGWFEMPYVWNPEGTEAFAAPDGLANANGTEQDVPSQQGCSSCHSMVGDVLIGPSAIQLSREGGDGPLTEWALAGRLSQPPLEEFEPPGTPVVKAALGYLHGNCGHCHRDGNFLASLRSMRLWLKTTDQAIEETGAYTTTFNQRTGHQFMDTTMIVVPGKPDASQLVARIQVRDSDFDLVTGFQMPPLCTEKVDDVGVANIRAWVEQLPTP